MCRRVVVGCLLVSILAVPVLRAQQDTTGRFSFIFIANPKPGMAKQFEDGMKKHIAWHTQQKDQRSYSVSVVAAGEGVGSYRVVYGGLRWQDQDQAAPIAGADIADVNLNISPSVESWNSLIALRLDSLSRIPATEPAKAMNWVTYTYVKPGKGPEYSAYLRRLREAHNQANSPYRYFVLTVIVGANTPAFALVRPADKWADFTPARNRQVLVQAFGELEADRLLNTLDDVVGRTVSFVTVRRPDLSYTPAGQ